jgi:hypothetical protein
VAVAALEVERLAAASISSSLSLSLSLSLWFDLVGEKKKGKETYKESQRKRGGGCLKSDGLTRE